jgi:hypothetical protein
MMANYSLKRTAAGLRHCWRFMVSTPWTFAASVPFIALYLLDLWTVLHALIDGTSRFGWAGHHWSFYPSIRFPQPPAVHIPFLGEPGGWSVESAVWGLVIMTLSWAGAVHIFAKKNPIGSDQP